MPTNKVKSVPVAWLQRNLFDRLDDATVSRYRPLQSVKAYLTGVEQSISTLAASSVDVEDALAMFSLTQGGPHSPWSLEDHDVYLPPVLLATIRKEIDFVTAGSPENEAYARCLLNCVLVCCVAEEKRLAIATPRNSSSTARPTTPEPAQLILRFETELHYPVKFKKEQRMLNGIADYTLWYDSNDSMGTNLVVVEAKRRGCTGLVDGQVIAYMGVVHSTRLAEGKRNAVVYGITTDGNQFRFWRVDNKSEVTKSHIYEWDLRQERQITSFIRYIIRAAIASSPTTSPVKDKVRREVNLALFRDPSSWGIFDYGVGLENDEDVELLDPPDIEY